MTHTTANFDEIVDKDKVLKEIKVSQTEVGAAKQVFGWVSKKDQDLRNFDRNVKGSFKLIVRDNGTHDKS